MKPEDAYHQIDPGAQPARNAAPGTKEFAWDDADKETENPTDTLPNHFNRILAFVCVSVIVAILAVLAAGGFLVKHPIPVGSALSAPTPEPTLAYTDSDIHALITESLTRFLDARTTGEKLPYIVDAQSEEAHLIDYYEARGNRDAPLKSVHLIKPILVGVNNLWVVSYTDTENTRRNATFERVANSFRMNWSSSYAYGQLSWKDFSTARPTEPVLMRAFLLHHLGEPPPGHPAAEWAAYVIEDNAGTFTQLAVMERGAEGQALIAESPRDARLPVTVELRYGYLQHGQPQLVIERLIHFKWYGGASPDKGTYSRRIRSGAPGSPSFEIDNLE